MLLSDDWPEAWIKFLVYAQCILEEFLMLNHFEMVDEFIKSSLALNQII